MLRPSRDYSHFRPGVVPSGVPPPINGPMGTGMNANVPMNAPMNMAAPPYAPPPMGGRGFVRPPGGQFAYPPPPPTPVPSPHHGPFLPPLQGSPFIPPLPPTPPTEAPPPPPPPPPPFIASPFEPSHLPHSILEQVAPNKQAPLPLPAQPSKPHDLEILKNIEGMAAFVVRNGPRYESMARAKHAGDPKFAFLFENDSGSEAVTNRDYYKWKKEVLQLQSEAVAESKSIKILGSESDPIVNNLTSLRFGQQEEIPGSPSVSDMDMEDDPDAPSPRRDSTKLSSMAFAEEPESPEKGVGKKPETLEKEVLQPIEISDSLNKGKQAQCRLTGDYTGALIDNYMSDISEDSDDLEPSRDLGLTGEREATAQRSKEELELSRQEPLEPVQLADASPSEATKYASMSEVNEQKNLESQGTDDDGHENQRDSDHVDSCEKGFFQSPLKESECEESRKRIRNLRRSRSKSRSSSHSRSPSGTRSRSRSASHEDISKSPSPFRSAQHNMLGRSPPKDLSSKDAERGDLKVPTGLKRGVKGGANVCLNYARGRCFRGDACRLQHQGSEKVVQGGEVALEPEDFEALKLTGLSQDLEEKSAPEVGNNEVPSAEVAATRKAKRKAGLEKMESNAKRLELKGETAKISGVSSQQVGMVTQELTTESNAGQPSPPPEDRATLDAAPVTDLLHLKASQASEVGIRSPCHPSEISKQETRNYGSPFRFNNHGTMQESGSTGVHPSLRPLILTPSNNAYLITNNEAGRTHGDDTHGGPVQFSSSALADSAGFQQSSLRNPGMIHSAASSGNPTHQYADRARNYASSLSQEYGLPLPHSGATQHTAVPPPVYPSVRQQHKFSTDTVRGYTHLQHGFTSPFSLPVQQQQSVHLPPFPDNVSRQSMFSDEATQSYGTYPRSSFLFTSQSQSYTPWATPGSSELVKSSSYSYALTTIPPLPSMIDLPGGSKPSNPSDQYDPLSDSLEPSVSGGSKSTSFSVLKTREDGKLFGGIRNTPSQLENVSPGYDVKGDPAETAGDPAVGIVENVSPPEDNRDWSPGQPVEAVEAKHGQLPPKNKKTSFRGLKSLRSAVADHVKEVLKPTWKEGHMSRDAFKNIVKKAVDKVTAALPPHHVPKSQEKVDQFMLSSRSKISKLVQGYIDKYQKT